MRLGTHLHVFYDNFGRSAFNVVFSGVGARLQASFEVALLSLNEILPGDFGEASPKNKIVELGLFLLLAVFVGIGSSGGESYGSHVLSRRSGAKFGVSGETSNQHDLVEIHMNR